MGRNRVIDRDAVLDAAQSVVTRDGASRLTLEAVAAKAGISKASVLYDYKTKDALMKALIKRKVDADRDRARAISERIGAVPNAAIRARIAAASRTVSDEERVAALSLCATVAQDAELRKPIQDAHRDRIAAVQGTSEHPRGAMLAYLAVEGMMCLEWLGLYSWTEQERDELLSEIRWLAEQEPVPLPYDTDAGGP